MPWPTTTQVETRLELVLQAEAEADLVAAVPALLAAVIAEFQAPIGPDGSGGTGRSFGTVTATRSYDGNGYTTLDIDDAVPGSITSVMVWGASVTDYLLQEPRPGAGYRQLVRRASAPLYGGGVWPIGQGNVSVTAQWGYAADVPTDVAEAVLCETVYRALVQGVVGFDGVGEMFELGSLQINTGQTATFSPIAHLHDVYLAAVKRYRVSDARQRRNLKWRMS